jgi:SAM-dependent methyltransferase
VNLSTDRQYFHDIYADADDPWSFASSLYEQRKYALTVDALPRERYLSAFEPGCSIGVLTELLAPRCDSLLAVDIIPSALRRAVSRLKDYENVIVESRAIPESWPDETFDLVVLSEIAYYFDTLSLRDVMERLERSTEPGAHVVAVHWRGETNYPLTGDQAHALINESKRLRNVVHHVEDAFLLDLWERVP